LFENEFFGHVGGAFTGARPHSDGLVAAAENGTLFLDEIDSLSVGSQIKLLRFLEDGEYRRLGESQIRRSNVRIIAATNGDLTGDIRSGRFREDLFFRLRVVPIEVPPLRDRREDIPLLLATYVNYYAKTYQLPKVRLSIAAVRLLKAYSWPGNIRELKNCVQYLTCLNPDHAVLAEELPLLEDVSDNESQTIKFISARPLKEVKRELVSRFEREYLKDALRHSNGNIAQAARASGKPRRAFFELMRKYGIDPKARFRDGKTFLDNEDVKTYAQ